MEFDKFARDDEDTITVENASKEKVVDTVKMRECLMEFNKFARDDEIQCGMCKLYYTNIQFLTENILNTRKMMSHRLVDKEKTTQCEICEKMVKVASLKPSVL
jgi:hypothetical protein